MNKDFIIYQKAVNYDRYIRKYVAVNIPNLHRDLRIHLLDDSYNMIKELFRAIYTKGNIRNKHIIEILTYISMLDFLSNTLLDVCAGNRKHIIKSIELLTSFKNMIYSWRSNIEKNQ